jgi:hypothetical protein
MRMRSTTRRGLAPLELVLALPILLFVMALIIIFGTVSCWKVRCLVATRWPRHGDSITPPPSWPATGKLASDWIGNIPNLDDPRVNQPVARGPLPLGNAVNSAVLDPTRGLRQDSASLVRNFPMLSKMGRINLSTKAPFLDDKWQYNWMGLGDIRQRRIPVLYVLAKAPATLVANYVATVRAILYAPFRRQLDPLDRDSDFIYYTGGPREFHPRMSSFCDTDRDSVAARVQDLIDRIQGRNDKVRRVDSLAKTMTNSFISMYQGVIAQYERLINSKPPNRPPAAEIARMEAEIPELKAKIKVLQDYAKTLRQ